MSIGEPKIPSPAISADDDILKGLAELASGAVEGAKKAQEEAISISAGEQQRAKRDKKNTRDYSFQEKEREQLSIRWLDEIRKTIDEMETIEAIKDEKLTGYFGEGDKKHRDFILPEELRRFLGKDTDPKLKKAFRDGLEALLKQWQERAMEIIFSNPDAELVYENILRDSFRDIRKISELREKVFSIYLSRINLSGIEDLAESEALKKKIGEFWRKYFPQVKEKNEQEKGKEEGSKEISDEQLFVTLAAALRKEQKSFGNDKDGKELTIDEIADDEIKYRYGGIAVTTKPKYVKKFLQFLEEHFSWSLEKKKTSQPEIVPRVKKETAQERAEKALAEVGRVVAEKQTWAKTSFDDKTNGYTQGQYDQLKDYLEKQLKDANAAFEDKPPRFVRVHHILEEVREAKFDPEKPMKGKPISVVSQQPRPFDVDDAGREMGEGLTDEERKAAARLPEKSAKKAAKRGQPKTPSIATVGRADQQTADNKIRNKISLFPKAEIFEGTKELEVSITDGPTDSSTGKDRSTFILTIDGEKITVLGADKDFTGKNRTITGKVILEYDASRTYNNVKVIDKNGDEVDLMTGRLIFQKDGVEREGLFFDATLDTLHKLKGLFSQESQERTYEDLRESMDSSELDELVGITGTSLKEALEEARITGRTKKAIIEELGETVVVKEILVPAIKLALPSGWNDIEKEKFSQLFAQERVELFVKEKPQKTK